MLYNIDLLKPHNASFILQPPKFTEKLLNYFGKMQETPKIIVDFSDGTSSAYIHIQNPNCFFGRISISSVPANCGSLFISDLFTKYPHLGIGTHLLKEIEAYALEAGYTMIFGNVPKYPNLLPQNDPIKFFEKMGYNPMGEDYVNVRSGNINRWFSKIIQLPEKEDEEE